MTVYVGYARPRAEGAAVAPAGLDTMTNDQLRALCAERGIEAPRRATKDALLKLLGA